MIKKLVEYDEDGSLIQASQRILIDGNFNFKFFLIYVIIVLIFQFNLKLGGTEGFSGQARVFILNNLKNFYF
jgi:hypothetical protein